MPPPCRGCARFKSTARNATARLATNPMRYPPGSRTPIARRPQLKIDGPIWECVDSSALWFSGRFIGASGPWLALRLHGGWPDAAKAPMNRRTPKLRRCDSGVRGEIGNCRDWWTRGLWNLRRRARNATCIPQGGRRPAYSPIPGISTCCNSRRQPLYCWY